MLLVSGVRSLGYAVVLHVTHEVLKWNFKSYSFYCKLFEVDSMGFCFGIHAYGGYFFYPLCGIYGIKWEVVYLHWVYIET